MPALDAFFAATDAAAEALAHPEVAARWDEPSRLDGMTVGAVAAHLAAGLDRFEALLAAPEPSDGPDHDLAAFYGANRIDDPATAAADPLHTFIRDDGAVAGSSIRLAP